MRLVHFASSLVLLATPAFATDVDLTSPGQSGTIGAAEFSNDDNQSSGTGVIEPFVRIQKTPQEHGFNTDAVVGSGDLSDTKAGTWTHSVRTDDLADSGGFVRLFLDINQSGSSPLISLDEMRIYTSSNPAISSLAQLTAQNLIYDMGFGNRVLMNAVIESGSGSGDMHCSLPVGLFPDGQYLYLYTKFGSSGAPYATNGGFEEWSALLKKAK